MVQATLGIPPHLVPGRDSALPIAGLGVSQARISDWWGNPDPNSKASEAKATKSPSDEVRRGFGSMPCVQKVCWHVITAIPGCLACRAAAHMGIANNARHDLIVGLGMQGPSGNGAELAIPEEVAALDSWWEESLPDAEAPEVVPVPTEAAASLVPDPLPASPVASTVSKPLWFEPGFEPSATGLRMRELARANAYMPAQLEMAARREKLPAAAMREELLAAVTNSQVPEQYDGSTSQCTRTHGCRDVQAHLHLIQHDPSIVPETCSIRPEEHWPGVGTSLSMTVQCMCRL